VGTPVDDSTLPTATEVVVVGAGLAGLACARRLSAAGVDDLVVLEASDGVGGRVRTDTVDGYRVDRGFQLLNPGYPEARRVLDLGALRLRALPAGVVVASGGHRRLLSDPRRTRPADLPAGIRGALTSFGGPRSKAAFARWALTSAFTDPSNLLAAPDGPWRDALTERGIGGPLRHAVLETFLAGTLGEQDGSTSRRFVELLLRSFVKGSPGVPWEGMQAIPEQLAAALPAGRLHLHRPVTAVTGHGAATADGTISARAVVVATDPVTAGRLTGVPVPAMRALTTFWHVAPGPPTTSAALHLDGDRRGPLVNTVVLSTSAPAYSPGSGSLVATTVLGDRGDTATERAVLSQLEHVYGAGTSRWQLLATSAVPQALPASEPPLDPRRPVDLGGGLFVAGDHRDTASQQGALVSGRRTADAVLRHLGLPVPPRPPLDGVRATTPTATAQPAATPTPIRLAGN